MAYVAQKGEGGGRTTGKLNDTVISRPTRGGSGGVARGMHTGSTKGGSSSGGGVVRKVASKTAGSSAFYNKVSK